jgi:malate dehydrogenase (oxaloacetate-decarboxylating)(NADP+)
MRIPVFHDDQHGTAIVCAAAIRNGLKLQGKQLADVKLVTSGAGAAAISVVDLLVAMGLPAANVTLTDIKGVVWAGRGPDDGPELTRYARETDARTLPEVLGDADVFLGLSAPHVLKPEWLSAMAPRPLILALANPEPEILPDLAKAARPDAIVATGRSDYPNQVNNVLCFPFVFRGALDADASTINRAMEIATVEAIADLAMVEVDETAAVAYAGPTPVFGPDYIIPRPFDPRLILHIAPAVAKAAAESGVARAPIADLEAYRRSLEPFVYRSGQLMRPVFDLARQAARRVVYAEGEDDRVLRAVQTVVSEGLAQPILIGRHAAIEAAATRLGLKLDLGGAVRVIDPESEAQLFAPMVARYQRLAARRGVPPITAAARAVASRSVAAALLLMGGEADAALIGGDGDWWRHFTDVVPIVPRRRGVARLSSIACLILPSGPLFISDTHVNVEPDAELIVQMTLLAAEAVARFGLAPKVALISHSNFGASNSPSARKMREAVRLVRDRAPDLEVDGEMHADAALNQTLRQRFVLDSPIQGRANLLIMPNIDAANIALTLLSATTEALQVGPLLLGMQKPLHVLVPAVTARGIVNMTALSAAQAEGGVAGAVRV